VKRRLAATTLLLALGPVGCADSERTAGSGPEPGDRAVVEAADEPADEPTDGTADEPTEDAGASPEEDAAAIEEVLITWDLEGGCEHMTDVFLEAQTFISERDPACEAFEAYFTEKQYTADDIVISDVEVDGDTASAVLGSHIAPDLTVTYRLVREGGAWLIDDAEL
jgi:hypothetical protein